MTENENGTPRCAERTEDLSRADERLMDITERMRAEQELRQTDQILHAVIRHSPLAIICTDLETNVVTWNPAAERIFGWRAEEVLGKPNPIVPKEKDEEYLRLRTGVREGCPYSSLQLQRQRRDGTALILSASSSALRDASGEVIGLVGIFEDITERTAATAALQESEEKFSKIFRQAPLLITLSEIETGRLIEVNAKFLEISGFAREELLGKTVLEIGWITAEQRARMKQTVLDQGRIVNMELSLRSKQGRQVECLFSGEIITVNGQQRLLAIAQDITERKRAEGALKSSERFIRNILDTVDEGFIVIDPHFRILTANKAYCDQAGLSCDEIIGRHCHEISHRSLRPCYEEGEECAVRQVFETGEPYTATHKHMDAQGTLLYVETKAFPIKNDSGEVTSVIETVSNITEKHLLEEERLKTQKLEAIGMLAGGVAHDFNNLLQGVFGYISLARMKLDHKEQAREMLAQAEEALHLSVNLTTQLLTFSKGGKPAKKRVSLRPVIENSVKFALSGSRVDYRLKIDKDLWMVDADEGQIGQVIQNVILNADQAMPLGGQVTIAARNLRVPGRDLPPLLKHGSYVAISVQDGGIGIPAKYLEKIFDPYFTTKDKGSGLGLATSYSIVRNHGGIIDVRSEVGKGTTFVIYLPAIEAAAKASMATVASFRLRHGRILVMDDETVVRNIAGELLVALGQEADYAATGEEAIEKYTAARDAGRPFDAVILDLTIRGGLGGRETMERLRALDPKVKAIVSSGYSDDAVVADHRAFGFLARLTKPYRLEDLKTALHAVLS